MDKSDCKKYWQIDRAASPWQGFTSTAEEEEKSKNIMAVSLKDSGYEAIPSLEKFSVSGAPLIGRSGKLRAVAVEERFFSDLKRVDVTRSTNGGFMIGFYKDTGFKFMKPAVLAEFLILSQIIITLWHVESHICLLFELETDEYYVTKYTGRHIYFTSSRHEEPLAFSIIIDKTTGGIFVKSE